jgi:hypothetical protein
MSDIENLVAKIAVEHSDIAVGTNQVLGKLDMEVSPIKAYSRKAFSKMVYLQGGTLKAAKDMELKISKGEVSWMPKPNVPQKATLGFPIDDSRKKEIMVLKKTKMATPPAKAIARTLPPTSSPRKNSQLGNKIFTVRGQPLSLKFLFTNIWFLRTALLACGGIISILLLAYTFLFLETFKTVGNTTSYFPWSWRIAYSNPGVVMNFFWVGIAVSVAPLIVYGFVFLKWVLPELQISLELFRKRLEVPVRSA